MARVANGASSECTLLRDDSYRQMAQLAPSVGTIVHADALGRGDLYQAVANAAPRLGWPSAGADEVVLWFHDRTPQQGRSAEQPCQSSKKASRGAASAERDQRVVVGRGVNPNWTAP